MAALTRLSRLGVVAALLAAGGWLLAGQPRPAAANGLAFRSPFASAAPLDSFLVFSAPPRDNIPDGQIHWVDAEVPGIDLRGPDGLVRSMCPEAGLAWSLAGGDTVGGGGQFVAVECQGAAQGWQMLAFHLCEIQIRASISASERQYTRVAPGEALARECAGGHLHLSLGYWAAETARRELPCPQWYVQGRHWVNAACLVQAQGWPAALPDYLNRAEDWELRLLRAETLAPLRRWALIIVTLGAAGYLAWSLLWNPTPAARRPAPAARPAEAALKAGIVFGFVGLLVMVSAGPVWPVGASAGGAYTAADVPYQTMAQAVGYEDWRLLKAFYQAAVPRTAAGRPASADEDGKVFPPEAAAAIPFGETNAADWGLIDPTAPGPYGQFRAWEVVAERWPVSVYERWVLGLEVSRTAERQRAGLRAMAANPALLALGRRLGKEIRAEDLYASSAGAVGRTQILPEYFAPGALCGDAASADVWNDPDAVAECTTRHLVVSGCWGSWWGNGDVWSALCGYNPGAWDTAQHDWYWAVLQDRMTRLAAASAGLTAPAGQPPAAGAMGERLVPTPVLGLLIAETLLRDGQGAQALPGPLAEAALALAPQMQTVEARETVRVVYRLFRAWVLIYYAPEELLALGVQL